MLLRFGKEKEVFQAKIIIDDFSTWPQDIVNFFQERAYVLQRDPDSTSQLSDDDTIDLKRLLAKYSLHGYHCTRLTDKEILSIQNDGLCPQNGSILAQRIDNLVEAGLLDSATAQRLKENNLADDEYRTGMIWFCFFPPSIEADGVSRFFRSWGGEALYNEYEDGDIGQALRTIGIPCVIEAAVPIIDDSHPFLESKLARVYMKANGISINERSILHESFTRHAVSPQNIVRVHSMPSEEFHELSGGWSQKT